MEMEKPKSDKQIEAEFNLVNDPTELNLYTTTKTGTPPSYNAAYESQIEKPKITMSADQTMFVCYHPAKPFPLQFSKDPGYHIWWQHDTDYMNSYRDQLTKKEVQEVRELRAKDAKVWTVTSLSNMLQVKPLAILLAAPLTDEQKLELEVERKLLTEWPKEQRKTYRANQELERLKYYHATRVAKSSESKETKKDNKRHTVPPARNAVV